MRYFPLSSSSRTILLGLSMSMALLSPIYIFANAETPIPPTGYPAGGLFMKYWQNLTSTSCPPGQAVVGFNSGATATFSTPICGVFSSSVTGGSGVINQFGSGMLGTLNFIMKYTPDGSHAGPSTIYESGGRVGVNTNTPSVTFDVNGTINTASGYCIRGVCKNSWEEITGSGQNAGMSGTLGYIAKFTPDGKNIGNSVMYESGKSIGIGTTNPLTHLHIVSDASSFGSIMLQGNEANGDGVSRANIAFKDVSPGAFGAQWNVHIVGSAQGVTSNYTPGSFAINRAGGYKGQTNRDGFVISPETMYVGIGVTKPTEKLDVWGNVKATSYLTHSDSRLKKNTKVIDTPLSKILKLHGYTFQWKDSGKADIGIIAQEVEKVFPEIVHTASGSDGYKSVEYGNLIAPVIEALREISQKDDSQEAKLDHLIEKLDQQEKRIRDLESQCSK